MATVNELVVKIGAENKQLRTALKQVQTDVKKMGNTIDKQSKKSSAAFGAMTKVFTAGAVLMVGQKIIQGIKSTTEAYNQQQQAVAQVAQALKSTGGVAGRTLSELKANASALQKETLFGDEEILRDATAQLLTFTNIAGTQFDRTQQAALDLSTRLGGDLKSASIQLGKALNDPVANLSALSRSGIQFSESQKEVINKLSKSGKLAEAQTIILDELGKQYGGSAAAAAAAGTGGFTQVSNAFGDIQERIGGLIANGSSGLVPVLKDIIEFFGLMLDNIQPVKDVFNELKETFSDQSQALGDLLKELGLVSDKATGAATVMKVVAGVFKAATAHFRLYAKVSTFVVKGITSMVKKFKELHESSKVFRAVTDFIIKPFQNLGKMLTDFPAKLSGFGAAYSTFFKKISDFDFKNLGKDSSDAYTKAYGDALKAKKKELQETTEEVLTESIPPTPPAGLKRKFNELIESVGQSAISSRLFTSMRKKFEDEANKSTTPWIVKVPVKFDTSGTTEDLEAELASGIQNAIGGAAETIAAGGAEALGQALGDVLSGGDRATVEELGLTRWTVPHTEIRLARIAEGDRQGQWVFTIGTVARAEEFYQRVRHLPYRPGRTGGHIEELRVGTRAVLLMKLAKVMPSWFKGEIGGMMAWQWFGLVLLVLLLGLAVLAVAWLSRHWRGSSLFGHRLASFLVPLALTFIPVVGGLMIRRMFELPGAPALVVRLVFSIVGYFGLAWLVALVISRIGDLTVRLWFRDARPLKKQLVRVMFRIATIVVVTAVTLKALQILGAPIAGLIAGLGVGGLAIALAAQGTLENFIGGIILYTDQPVRVGDVCRFGGKRGTVEDVGLRSVKIRTLDRTLVTVPNADFAKMQLENLSERDRVLLREELCLRYETTREQLQLILSELEVMLQNHPQIADEGLRVRFTGFGRYYLEIELYAYAMTSAWPEFLLIRQNVLVKVMDIIGRSGTRLALPTEVHYSARDVEGLDAHGTEPESPA